MPQRNYRLRKACMQDVASLVELERQFPSDRLTRSHWRHLLTRAHADVLLVEFAGAPVGNAVLLYRHRSRRARLYSLVVAPSHRRRGLGARLLAGAERRARRRGCHVLMLEVRSGDHGAQALYSAHDYRATTHLPRYYEDGEAAIRYVKSLHRTR